MLLSSCQTRRAALEETAITQHRPEHVDASASEGDERLVVPATLAALALVKARLTFFTPAARISEGVT